MDPGITAEAEVHRMSERQQPGLAQQQVVRQREHRRNAHLREQRAAEVAVESGHVRQQDQGEHCSQATIAIAPTSAAARPNAARPRSPPLMIARAEQAARPHDQHQRPEGDRAAAALPGDLDRGELVERRVARDGDVQRAEEIEQRVVERDGEGLHDADQHRGDERARDRAQAADDDHDEDDRPERCASWVAVSSTKPPMTPARPASALPIAKTSTKMRGTSWPSALTISGCASAARMTRPSRVRLKRDVEEREHAHRDRHHQPFVGGIAGAEERGTAGSR